MTTYSIVVLHDVDEEGFDYLVVGDADEQTLVQLGIDTDDDEQTLVQLGIDTADDEVFELEDLGV